MNFHDLRSIISSKKSKFKMENASPSFQVSANITRRYIEPSFTKADGFFDVEQPTFLLISAVGASGKSMLSMKLSLDTGLPLLDLGLHAPVAAHAMTGLITTSYANTDLSAVFSAIKGGEFGVIIDGLDEGLSKAGEKPFEAFLDDLLQLSRGSPRTSFVLLGRTKTVEDCWLYLAAKGATTGLASLDPFNLDKAREYIDTFANPPLAGQRQSYIQSRDLILSKLSDAFSQEGDRFLSFVGYPPVLDAVATLLDGEKNYHRLSTEVGGGTGKEIEKNLLWKITGYIMERERAEKVVPQLVEPIASELKEEDRAAATSSAYSTEEQCVRLVAHCLGEPVNLRVFPQPVLNAKYEDGLSMLLDQHPFVAAGSFRNAVFEAASIAVLIASAKPPYVEMVDRYVLGRKRNYHIVYLLDETAEGRPLPSEALHVLIGAALELRPAKMGSEIVIEPSSDPAGQEDAAQVPIGISIGIFETESGKESKAFEFTSEVTRDTTVFLGSKLQSCFVDLPCNVQLSGAEIDLTAPVDILARRIDVQAQTLIARAQSGDSDGARPEGEEGSGDRSVVLEAETASSSLTKVIVHGAELLVTLSDKSGHAYPLIQFIQVRSDPSYSGRMEEIYLKLRKILTHFRSHGRGGLAKCRDKVDNPRVAGNPTGALVLARLLKDGVLYSSGNFYYLRPANVDKYLGISWPALRGGLVSERLEAYMETI
jgi:hypothetical protein